jgi:glycosyltransferase involved in cell wall biosynthesis
MTPTISVVTICKNAEASIERTLASVLRCSYPGLQYVVVDGGSTDGTGAIIQRYRSGIDRYISEPDDGISDALNKAIELTDGDYHLIVHADDVLLPEAPARLIQSARHADAQVVCGTVLVIGKRGVVRKFVPEPARLLEKMSIPHMGSLVRRSAWATVGRYDKRRKIAMDHLLMLRILKCFGPDAFSVVDTTVANYHLGGISDKCDDVGFREVRANLLEEGAGAFRANSAYLKLLLKSRIARLMGRS